jgi:hypothetical protein
MRKLLVLGALGVSGCSGGFLGGGDHIDLTPLKSDQAVPFSEIVQNIRCDVQSFLQKNNNVKTFSMGGLITAKTSYEAADGSSLSGTVPVATSISVALGAEHSSSRSLGIETKQPIIVYWQDPAPNEAAIPTIDCTTGGFQKSLRQAPKLSGPLLNLEGMREQMERIPTGNPRLRLPGFRVTGSIFLVRSKKFKGKIDVFFVSGGADSSRSNSYRIDFDLATNWKPIVKDYEIEAAKEPSAPTPTIVYVVQAPPPAAKKTGKAGKPVPPGGAPIPPYVPIPYSLILPGFAFPGVVPPAPPKAKTAKELEEEAARKTEEVSRPKPDVPK